MRIAYFSPLPPLPTGVADYSDELLPHMAELASIELFVDGDVGIPARTAANLPARDYREFERLVHRYDACIYHIGNDPSHRYVLDTMLRFPSFTVLHDVSIHPLLVALSIGHGDLVGYLREMGYAYGRQGIAEARSAYFGRFYRYEDFPLCQRLVDLSLGVIVHSRYAADTIRSVRPLANMAVVPHGISRPSLPDRDECRRRLGLDAGEFVVGALGFATPKKRLEPALRAFKRLLESRPDSRFLVVGEVAPWYDLAEIIESLGLGPRVVLTGRVSMEEFCAYAAASDVCLALRFPTSGETSGALLRCMAAGRPAVVSKVGSFAELPETTCLHVPVDDFEEDAILEALKRLAEDESLRYSLGQEALSFVTREHSWQETARGYCGFIENTLEGL